MSKKTKFIFLTSLFFLLLAGLVYAQPGGSVCDPSEGLCNPLGDRDVTQILDDVVDFLLAIAVPLAVVASVWAGLLFMTAGGSEDRIRLAKRAITYTVIGIAILMISKGITTILLTFFT